jgi:hypothetical protein
LHIWPHLQVAAWLKHEHWKAGVDQVKVALQDLAAHGLNPHHNAPDRQQQQQR